MLSPRMDDNKPDYMQTMWGDDPQRLAIDMTVASYHLKGQDVAIYNPVTGETELHPVPKND